MSETLPDLYTVEKIVEKRIRNNKVEYFVKWEGYPKEQNTWEPKINLENVLYLVDAFENSLRSKKKGPSTNEKLNTSFCK